MTLPMLFDLGAGFFTGIFGPGAFAIWGIPAILVEALILRIALPEAKALKDSLVINVASTLVGLVLFIAIAFLNPGIGSLFGAVLDLDSWDVYQGAPAFLRPYVFTLFVLFWAMTILVEGPILKIFLEPQVPLRRVLATVTLMNLVSYLAPLIALMQLIS